MAFPRTVADLLSSALPWLVMTGEVRAPVHAVDGVRPEHDGSRYDLEDLSSSDFGK